MRQLPKGNGIEFNVEKGIPLPPPMKQRPFKYPWATMEVGDSILIEGKDFFKRDSARCASYSYGKRTGKVFLSRVQPDGLRIWRTA